MKSQRQIRHYRRMKDNPKDIYHITLGGGNVVIEQTGTKITTNDICDS